MRKNVLAAGIAGIAVVGATAVPAAAIKWGELDGDAHPHVGFMVAYTWQPVDTDDDGEPDDTALLAAWRCTGTQMDDDTFLTAGHCTDGAAAAAIWFDADLTDMRADGGFASYQGAIDADNAYQADAWSTAVLTHPDYDPGAFYLHDVGVVDNLVLADGVLFDAYGELPAEGYWDEQLATRKKDRDSYTTVGYGLQWAMPLSNGQGRGDQDDWIRMRAGGELIGYRQFGGGKTNDAYVVLTNNARTGGTCFGDSGGPTFVEDSTTVAAVTSFGVNSTCAGTSGVYRIDTADDLEWLSSFVNG